MVSGFFLLEKKVDIADQVSLFQLHFFFAYRFLMICFEKVRAEGLYFT